MDLNIIQLENRIIIKQNLSLISTRKQAKHLLKHIQHKKHRYQQKKKKKENHLQQMNNKIRHKKLNIKLMKGLKKREKKKKESIEYEYEIKNFY